MYLFMLIHAIGVAKVVMDQAIRIVLPAPLTQTSMEEYVNAPMVI